MQFDGTAACAGAIIAWACQNLYHMYDSIGPFPVIRPSICTADVASYTLALTALKVAHEGDWVVRAGTCDFQVYTNAEFTERFRPEPDPE